MKRVWLAVPAALALVTSTVTPAHAAPACVVLNWRNGDACYFEAPAGEYAFAGIATEIPDGQDFPWVAVQVSLHGQVIASCYDEGTPTEPAQCIGRARAFVSNVTHKCQAFGTGGPKFHCADPPALPIP